MARWRMAHLAHSALGLGPVGGVGALVAGAGTYLLALTDVVDPGLPPIVVALASSTTAMLVGGSWGSPDAPQMTEQIAALHADVDPIGR